MRNIKAEIIYRIHHNETLLMHVIPPIESMNKLGEEYGTFAFNAEPKKYASIWTPLHIEFLACEGRKTNIIPDISENFGRLFLSEAAHKALKELLESSGELLPVTYGKDNKGYIFNPLVTAEEMNALETRLTTYDEYDNLTNFGFIEQALKTTTIFKTKLDCFKGIFCLEAFKQAYENAELTGITFHPDVSNPIGEAYGSVQ